ncbi:VOC family protein [Bacillus sp. FJAT-49711]|uniref:VOC family protein n=1 Tax=Bacillus sp. FJAT-49711 TaxID=2833585 RepID=UPI001BC93793|nr:VOC family protein [Bacillus sp. FJAT-49711]MBS4218258.1 VOC family protein [Bacillus sp. FJAT-49711]
MKSPVLNELGGIFIPVSNIEKSRDWYCELLGVPNDGEIPFGHLYVLPMGGPDIVLDSKIYSPDRIIKLPLVQFKTNDIVEAYNYLKSTDVEIVTEIQHNHYFNFIDPDGNQLMMCRC